MLAFNQTDSFYTLTSTDLEEFTSSTILGKHGLKEKSDLRFWKHTFNAAMKLVRKPDRDLDIM